MEEVGVLQHNMANSSPVVVRKPDLRQHVERPGRKPRERALAEGAGNHCGGQEDRQAGVGRQLGRRKDPARPVVVAGGRARSATWCRSSSARATAGSAATRRRPARSSGSSTSTRRTRSGRRPATRSSARRSSSTTSSTSPTVRIPNTAKVSATCTPSTPPSAATSPRPASFGITATSAARSRPARSSTASSSTRTSADSCTPRRQDRQAVLEARHVRRDLGLADGHRRQGLPWR